MTDKIDIPSNHDHPKNRNSVRATQIDNISTADDEINLTEPSSPNHSQTLYNNVEESLSGHVTEIDDTPGAERLNRQHRSGTFEEIHPDGTRVIKIFGDDFHISLSDNTLVVGGNLNITVQGDANILTKGDVKHKIGGDYDLKVAGNMTTRVKGKRLDYTKGTHDIQSKANISLRNEGNFNHYSKGSYKISCSSSINTHSKGNTNIFSSGNAYMDGNQVHFNLPGPGVSFNAIEETDPSGGLTISDSVIEPDVDTLKILNTNNSDLINILDNDGITYPKDRVKDN